MNRRAVLNIDPDSETRARVSQTLRALGMDVEESSTPCEAIELAKSLQPALAVVSSKIQGEDIGAFCRDFTSVCTALVLLRVPAPGKKPVAHVAGVAGYVVEPLQPAYLGASARSLLRLWEAEHEGALVKQNFDQLLADFYLCISRVTHDASQAARGYSTLCEIAAPELAKWPPDKARYLQQVMESAERTQILLKDLASYAQISRETEATHRNMDLTGAVLAAQAKEQGRIDEAGAQIFTQGLPAVRGNPARLQQLIGCLLSNSLTYRNNGTAPRIQVTASPEASDSWRISVADNGIGIDAQYHDSVFTPFQRLHGKEVPGSGLGLAICRKIVRAHGGRMWVESSLGKGSTFFFILPASRG